MATRVLVKKKEPVAEDRSPVLQSFMTTLRNFRSEDFLCDTLLVASGCGVRVHKIVVAAWSKVLAAEIATTESHVDVQYELAGLTEQQLSSLVEFFYSGKIKLNIGNATAYLNVASELDIPQLRLLCESFSNKSALKKDTLAIIESCYDTTPVKFAKTEKISNTTSQFCVEVGSEHLDVISSDIQAKDLTCQSCKFIAHNSELLELHVKMKHSNGKFTCNECSFTFVNNIKYIAHMKKFHNNSNKKYRCSKCQTPFDSLTDWKKHVENCPPVTAINIEKKENADKQNETSGDVSDYETDEEMMHELRSYLKQNQQADTADLCKMCVPLFSRYEQPKNICSLFKVDKLNSSSSSGCSLCDFVTDKTLDLYQHIHESHINRLLHCERCEVTHKYIESAADHKANVHQLPNELLGSILTGHTCDECNFFTYCRKTFLVHRRKHLICSKCEVQFNSSRSFLSHVCNAGVSNWRKKNSVQCRLCDYTTFEKKNMEYHMYSKHQVLSGNKTVFKCTHCDYTSLAKRLVQKHIHNRHSDERPHVCSVCKKGFKTTSALNVHVRRHNNEVYKCKECEYETNTKDNLKSHLQRCHPVGKVYYCSLCPYTSGLKHELEKHMRKVKHKQPGKFYNRRARMGLEPPNTAQSIEKWKAKRRLQTKLKKAKLTESDVNNQALLDNTKKPCLLKDNNTQVNEEIIDLEQTVYSVEEVDSCKIIVLL